MKNIETAILSFDNWSQPWTFHGAIITNPNLNDQELAAFDALWIKCSGVEFWREYDLVLSCKASHNFIRQHYSLSEVAIGKIVRALSYNYR